MPIPEVPPPEDEALESETFLTYYCAVCGTNALFISHSLENMMRRRTDNAYIISGNGVIHKKYLEEVSKMVVIKRKNGLEKQYRWKCAECGAIVAYQS